MENTQLIRNLRNIAHTMRQLSEGKAGQKRVLIMLLTKGGMTQRALTQHLGVQPGTASEVIGKLENAGLLQRRSSDNDRRTADLFLTEAGREQAVLALKAKEQRQQEMFACLDQAEKEQLLVLLEKINADWDTRYREVR